MGIKNAKAKGSRLERRTKEWLETRFGCVVTTKAGGSLGAIDVVGIAPEAIFMCQVKANKPPGPDERARLQEVKNRLPAWQTWIVVWKDRQREPEVTVIRL